MTLFSSRRNPSIDEELKPSTLVMTAYKFLPEEIKCVSDVRNAFLQEQNETTSSALQDILVKILNADQLNMFFQCATQDYGTLKLAMLASLDHPVGLFYNDQRSFNSARDAIKHSSDYDSLRPTAEAAYNHIEGSQCAFILELIRAVELYKLNSSIMDLNSNAFVPYNPFAETPESDPKSNFKPSELKNPFED